MDYAVYFEGTFFSGNNLKQPVSSRRAKTGCGWKLYIMKEFGYSPNPDKKTE